MTFCREMWWLSLRQLLIHFSLNQSSDSCSATSNHGANKLKIMSPLFVVKCRCWATQHVCEHSTSFMFFSCRGCRALHTSGRRQGSSLHKPSRCRPERTHTVHYQPSLIHSHNCLTLIHNAVATLTETFFKECPVHFLFFFLLLVSFASLFAHF